MEKYFVTYKQALALKELGFSKPCLGFYDDISKYFYQIHSHASSNNDVKNITIAPLKSQVFEWFREKYNLVIEPCLHFQRTHQTEDDHFEIIEFGYRIFEFDQFRGGRRTTIEWDGYENSVEEIAESTCIDKLIEIVKNK